MSKKILTQYDFQIETALRDPGSAYVGLGAKYDGMYIKRYYAADEKILTGTKADSFNGRTGGIFLSKSDVENVLTGTITSHSHATSNADTLDGLHLCLTNGNGGPAWNGVPWIRSDGVLEIGKYIDFHDASFSGNDFDCRLTSNGNTLLCSGSITGSNFILSSDRKLKTKIKPIACSVEDIEFVEFEMVTEPGRQRYGVIAQDVEKVSPELVYTDANGMKSVAYIDLLIAKVAQLEKMVKQLQNGNP